MFSYFIMAMRNKMMRSGFNSLYDESIPLLSSLRNNQSDTDCKLTAKNETR